MDSHQNIDSSPNSVSNHGATVSANSAAQKGRRVCLFTIPRTASNLLIRILNFEEQPNVITGQTRGGYFFYPALFIYSQLGIEKKRVTEYTDEQRTRLMGCYQKCFGDVEEFVRKAEAEGKIAFAKEHALSIAEPVARTKFLFGADSVKGQQPWEVKVPDEYAPHGQTHSELNESVYPDEFLQTWSPVFLVRHPALSFPSLYRAIGDANSHVAEEERVGNLDFLLTFHWARTIYDWYERHLAMSNKDATSSDGVVWPIVLEADDIINEPEVLVRFCEIVGMDPSKLKYEWKAATEEDKAKLGDFRVQRFLSTLADSAGIRKDKTSAGIDIDIEAKTWRDEFGEADGAKVERAVRDALPDYEYMKSRRLRPSPSA